MLLAAFVLSKLSCHVTAECSLRAPTAKHVDTNVIVHNEAFDSVDSIVAERKIFGNFVAMDHPRPCGCKGCRTCLICEKEYGIEQKPFIAEYEVSVCQLAETI